MSSPWLFGNTTVRNPLRIRAGLDVLNRTLNGDLIGKTQERRFADELDRAGIVRIADRGRDYSDLGRKWRACLSQLGFITHKFDRSMNPGQVDSLVRKVADAHPDLNLKGRAYEVTPNGQRMIAAETLQEQQECMLRALVAYEIPSVIESHQKGEVLRPFIVILQVLWKLGLLKDPQGLTKVEMAVVQVCRDHDAIDGVVDRILEFRAERDAADGSVGKRRVEEALLSEIAATAGVSAQTLTDYADVNFRYPRSTGLVSMKGSRLVLNDRKIATIEALIDDVGNVIGKDNPIKYLARLWRGAELPTDDELTAREEIRRLRGLLIELGVSEADIPDLAEGQDTASIDQVRIRMEMEYQSILEGKYAAAQRDAEQVKEIIAYLKRLDKQAVDEETYDLDIVDEPSYLEWAVWRAFLAINCLVNGPQEARRFRVDSDFLPMGCAPGGGPDMIFEFSDYVLVVEVTLTSSSRQEAAEGEPVRRHVAKVKADIAKTSPKPVYGLFIARQIDNNTAETFRVGVWYTGDEPDFINIVPLTLEQLILLMEKYLEAPFSSADFRRLLDSCLIPRNAHAPAWKREIGRVVNGFLGRQIKGS